MIKTLSKVGNSSALILDKTLLELIGVEERGDVELQVQGDRLVIMPAKSGARQAALDLAHEDLMARFGSTYQRLAVPPV